MPEFLTINTAHLARLMVFLLCLPAGLLQAQVQSRLSHQVTGLDQPVRLTIEIDGGEDLSPNLTPLEQDFEILSRSTQQSISVINGEMTSKRSLNLTLLPLRSGSLTIPAIEVGDQTTQPLPLQVEQKSQEEAQATRQALIELSLNKDSAYLEEQILLTLKLYQAKGVRGESLDPPVPSLDNTQISLIHEDRYSSRKDGVDYRVVERVYALFARQTGTLTLNGVKFRGRSGGSRDPFSSFFSNGFPSHQQSGRIIRAESDPVSLEILPIPQGFTGERWLPAENLQIVENGIDDEMALAGNPITRRVMIIADGVMSNHLPSIEQSMPSGLKLYPESPHLNDKPNRSGISSSLQQSLTLIATDPGTYTLPPIEIPWWNTETRQQEIARLPAKEISFMPNPSRMANQAQHSAAAQPSEQSLSVEKTISASPESADDFPWLATLFGLAWLITISAWWFSSRQKQPTKPMAIKEPNQQRSNQPELENVLQQLTDAYQAKDGQAARDAWLHWALLSWPDNPPNNLSRLARRCHPDLAKAVNALERAIYSPNSEISWSDYEILKLIEAKDASQSADKAEQNLLIPLNP
ncbi:MAG: BatD family protein [Candidatus Thiodiazotropha lotti]|nr:BatD family protein [Candidatus Thiodiazotropha lotti]MCW4186052.1 BatD family protein [Candidatus Thiodiazotropha lotti]